MDDQAAFDPAHGTPEAIAPGLRRIVAPNPSAMTFRGTNTYLVGTRDIAVIDPGPPDETHLKAIIDALEGHQRISHIFVTHSHIDHSPLAMVLAQLTDTKVHGFGSSRAGRAPIMATLPDLGGGEGVDETFMPDLALAHLSVVEGSDWALRALHTPGHMGNHLCFELDWKGQFSGHVFTGDMVMGWASSLVSPPDGDLGQFMTSLEMLRGRAGHERYHPGHGAAIEDPQGRVAGLLAHRQAREAQIIAALQHGPAAAKAVAAQIYTDLDPALLPAAARNVLAHLIDLAAKGRASCSGQINEASVFELK
jgi:glyoxylase-like metal-dependent hydrolase (beta-lactamase superfamily II)